MADQPIQLDYEGGTVVLSGAPADQLLSLPHCQSDPRTGVIRAEGRHYRPLIEHLWRNKVPFTDNVPGRSIEKIDLNFLRQPEPCAK